jgi:myo-inositol-1(or 4)-monophosphatase
MIDFEKLLNIALIASKEAFEISKIYITDSCIKNSIGKDIKTLADQDMHEAIVSILESTGIPIISEESDKNDIKNLHGISWIIDPLDGTMNFSRGYKCSGISISLIENGIFKIGVIRDIFNNDCFSCLYNQGAFLNNIPIKVSETSDFTNAILATGFPSGSNFDTASLFGILQNIQNFKKIRTIGSASIMLSNVASGIFDVYYEKDIYLWDVAAGLALVKEAGGEYLIRKSGNNFKYEVLASNRHLFQLSQKKLFYSSK